MIHKALKSIEPVDGGAKTAVVASSMFSGDREQIWDIPYARMADGVDMWRAGNLIQNAFPFLDADQREFLLTGMTAEEWDDMEREENGDDDEPAF
jgi:hypothetical protein